jgi:hypothetical protein
MTGIEVVVRGELYVGCNQRNIVANIQLAATAKVDYGGHPKSDVRPVQRLASIKPSSYTCESCNNTFASWKEAKEHLKS